MTERPVTITGLAGASALGSDVAEQQAAMTAHKTSLRPLSQHPDTGNECPDLLAGWITDRSWLSGRKYGGASNASVRAARAAVADAGWTKEQLAGCHVFSGTSRGNTGELFGKWNARDPVRKWSTSNSMHSETASAVSVELGIRGEASVVRRADDVTPGTVAQDFNPVNNVQRNLVQVHRSGARGASGGQPTAVQQHQGAL